MFLFTNFFSVFIPFWGMIGFWTNRIGYHHRVSIYSVTSYKRSQLNYKPISGNSISTMSYSVYSKRLTTPYAKTSQPLPEILVLLLTNKNTVRTDYDQRAHAARVRQYVLCPFWGYKPCSQFFSFLFFTCPSLKLPVFSIYSPPYPVQPTNPVF